MAVRIHHVDPKWIPQILDKILLAVTVFDLKGITLFYDEYSPRIINRKPKHLGKDIRLCHQKPESNARIGGKIEEFNNGRREAVSCEARPYGKPLLITVSPLEIDRRLVGCIHTGIPKPLGKTDMALWPLICYFKSYQLPAVSFQQRARAFRNSLTDCCWLTADGYF